MSEKTINTVEEVVVEGTEETAVVEVKKESKVKKALSKTGEFVGKHKKKIAVAAVGIGCGAAGYVFGRKKALEEGEFEDEYDYGTYGEDEGFEFEFEVIDDVQETESEIEK